MPEWVEPRTTAIDVSDILGYNRRNRRDGCRQRSASAAGQGSWLASYLCWSNAIALFILLALSLAPAVTRADDPSVAVYVHNDVRQDSISLGALRTIVGMRLRSWKDGSPIHVFVLPDTNPLHVDFCKRILGIYPHQLRWAWDRLVYSGTGQAPVQVSTEEQMLRMIKTVPGAIGYLRRDPNDDHIHVLEIK